MRSSLPTTESELTTNHQLQGKRLPASRFVLFLFPCVAALAIDLWTKHFTFSTYFEPGVVQVPAWWIEGVLGIQTSTNAGALFGLGQGYSSVFAVFSIFALAGILIWMFPLKGAFDRWLTFALGLISGGILGNLYDRIGWGHDPSYPDEIKGHVRDWIYFRLEGIALFDPWPNFNIADSALVCGAIMLVVHTFFYGEPSRDTSVVDSGAEASEATDQVDGSQTDAGHLEADDLA